MRFSVLLKSSGFDSTYDVGQNDIARACKDAGLDVDETEPGDCEYEYLADEMDCKAYRCRCEDEDRDPDDCSNTCGWEDSADACGCGSCGWRLEAYDITASGIIDRKGLTELIEGTGAFMNDCETLGTLGGPLGLGIVPDTDWTVESQQAIVCLRITPGVDIEANDADHADRIWARLRGAMLTTYGIERREHKDWTWIDHAAEWLERHT